MRWLFLAAATVGGTARNGSDASASLSANWREVIKGQEVTNMAFFATSANQRSWEDNQLGHGVFTWFLIKGLKREATTDFGKAIELDPKDALAYHNRGAVRSDLGDKWGAIADFSKAVELDPQLALAYYNRGNTKSDLGDKKGAVADLINAAKLGYEPARKQLKENGYSWQ